VPPARVAKGMNEVSECFKTSWSITQDLTTSLLEVFSANYLPEPGNHGNVEIFQASSDLPCRHNIIGEQQTSTGDDFMLLETCFGTICFRAVVFV
jgi:hypothetical protein